MSHGGIVQFVRSEAGVAVQVHVDAPHGHSTLNQCLRHVQAAFHLAPEARPEVADACLVVLRDAQEDEGMICGSPKGRVGVFGRLEARNSDEEIKRRRPVEICTTGERSVIDRPNGSRPGRQSGSGLVVRKGSPSAPPISLPTARAGGVKGLKAVGFLAKPTLDAAEHAGTARMLPGYGSSRVTRT